MKKCDKYDFGKIKLVFLKVKFVSNRLTCLIAKVCLWKEGGYIIGNTCHLEKENGEYKNVTLICKAEFITFPLLWNAVSLQRGDDRDTIF